MARTPRDRMRSARGLYLVLTEPGVPHADLAGAAVERGVPVIQLREKTADDAELLRLARSLRRATRGTGTLFIVNDRPDVAALVGADGVHVGPRDARPAAARRAVGPDAIVGVSVTSAEEAIEARAAGADYVGAGPIFPTATKLDAAAPIGLGGLAEIVASVPGLPVVAIGGIDGANAGAVAAAGAPLVAVVSAVCRAANPIGALDALLRAVGGTADRDAAPAVEGETRVWDIDGQVNHEGLRHCPRCAAGLAEADVREHKRLHCPRCGYIVYMTPAPVTCVLVARAGAVLLVRRRYAPQAGLWCIPAGFIEAGEAPSESAVREVKEETGLDVVITGVFDTWATGEDPRTPVVCIAFTGEIVGGALSPGDDADAAAFFTEAELPADIAFTTHRAALEKYFQARRRIRP
jgi:thiamine-phosphate pyrophosphorylase